MVTLAVDTSAIVDTQNIDANDVLGPIADLKLHLEHTLNGIQAFDRLSFGVAEALTIASGVISPTKTHVVVDTEAAAASDDLDTINNGAVGRIMRIRNTANARVVVLRHNGGGTGNIRTRDGNSISLNNTNMYAELQHDGTNWIAVLVNNQNLGADTTLTIAGGAVTRSLPRHLIDTEAAAASDDLDTISGGVEGDYLELCSVNTARVVRLTAAGNIRLVGSSTRKLETTAPITLRYDGTNWAEEQQAVILRTPLSSTLFGSTLLRVPDRAIADDGVSNGYRLSVLPAFEASNIILVQAAAATLQPTGCATPTIANTPANANDADSVFITLPSTAAAGNLAGFISTTFNLTRRQHNPEVVWLVKTPATPDPITSVRYWPLLTSAAITDVDTIAGATEVAGFRFSTVAGDAGWRPVVKDSTTQNTGAAIGTVAANTLYLLKLRLDTAAGIAYFTVKTSFAAAWPTETQLSTNLPAAATDLGACVRVIPQAASIRVLNFGRMSIVSQ